jgi:hypothetical protein
LELKYKKILQVKNMVSLVKKKKGPTETYTYKVTAISCQDQGKPNTQEDWGREKLFNTRRESREWC